MASLVPFDSFFGPRGLDDFFGGVPELYGQRTWIPKADIEDLGDHYEIAMDVPGFDKKEIRVDYNDGVLSITGKKEKAKDEEKRRYLRKERIAQSFQRSFLVESIDDAHITAAMKDGVLTIKIPKKGKENHSISIG